MIDLLSKFLDGRISSSQAMGAWPDIDDPTDDKLMQGAWYSLYYYDIDSDIRSKEPSYEARQKAELQIILNELRASLANRDQ